MDPIQKPSSAPPALFWRPPPGPIPAGTPLVVAPTECVVAVAGGAILGILPPGNHTLHPQALPFLAQSVDAASNVTADLWFVFTSDFRGCQFGAPLGRQLDPSLGLEATPLVSGDYSVKVVDPPAFVLANLSVTDATMALNALSGRVLGKMKELVARLVAEKGILCLLQPRSLIDGLNPMLADLRSLGVSVQVQNVSVTFSDEERTALMAASAKKAAAGRAAYAAKYGSAAPATAGAPAGPPVVAPGPVAPASKRNSGLIVGALVGVVVLGSIVMVAMHHSHAAPGPAAPHHGRR